MALLAEARPYRREGWRSVMIATYEGFVGYSLGQLRRGRATRGAWHGCRVEVLKTRPIRRPTDR